MGCGCGKTKTPKAERPAAPETSENQLRREQRQAELREKRAAAWRKRRGLE